MHLPGKKPPISKGGVRILTHRLPFLGKTLCAILTVEASCHLGRGTCPHASQTVRAGPSPASTEPHYDTFLHVLHGHVSRSVPRRDERLDDKNAQQGRGPGALQH